MLEIDHQLTDDVNMVLSYSYHTRDYEDWADYDHSVSVVPYALGPIKTNVGVDPTTGNPGVGMRTYDSEQNIDYSANESEWSQTEIRFSSDFDGKFNFTAGYYYNETGSETDYHIKSPSLMYYGNTNNGPHCVIFPATCNVGGIAYWGTFFAGLPAGIASATGLAQIGAIPPSSVLATGLGLASGGIVMPGVPGANAAAVAAMAGRTGGLPLWQQTYRNDSNLNRDENAAYGEIYYDISDDTRLTLGGRWSEYRIIDNAYTALADLTGQGAGVVSAVQPAPVTRSFEGEEFTYKLGFDHNLNDDQLVYATFSTGFKPGGSNPTSGDAGVNTYDPEEVEVFEVGMKNTLMDGRLQLNVSAYQNEITGLQLSKIVRRSSINENADATIKGVEAEFTFFVTNTLMLDGFYAWTDATIDSFLTVDPLNPGGATQILPYGPGQTGFLSDFAPLAATCNPLVLIGQAAPSAQCALGLAASNAQLGALVKYRNTDAGMVFSSFGSLCTQPYYGLDSTTLPCPTDDGVVQDLSGNRLPGSAEDNYRLGLTKFFDRPGGTFALRVDYSFRGDNYSDTYNRKRDYIEEYDVVDLSLNYTPNDGDWYVGAYVRNLSDSDHIYAKYNTDPTIGGFANGVALDPKIMGINFGINF